MSSQPPVQKLTISNVAILGQQSAAKAAKKKAKRGQIEEIVFDDTARRKFLTGFHKRKMDRDNAVKKRAQERDRLEKIAERQKRKQEMLEQAKQNRMAAERAYGNDEMEDEFEGLTPEMKGKSRQTEEDIAFDGEDMTATVTIVEEFDIDQLVNGHFDRKSSPEPTEGKPKWKEDVPKEKPSCPKKRKAKEANESTPLLAAAPPKRKRLSFESGGEKRDRLMKEKRKFLKKAAEARERGKPPKKKKDDGGRKRPSMRKK